MQRLYIIFSKNKLDIGIDKSDAFYFAEDVAPFGFVRFQKPAAGRDVIKNVLDRNGGSGSARYRLLFFHFRARYYQERARFIILPSRF